MQRLALTLAALGITSLAAQMAHLIQYLVEGAARFCRAARSLLFRFGSRSIAFPRQSPAPICTSASGKVRDRFAKRDQQDNARPPMIDEIAEECRNPYFGGRRALADDRTDFGAGIFNAQLEAIDPRPVGLRNLGMQCIMRGQLDIVPTDRYSNKPKSDAPPAADGLFDLRDIQKRDEFAQHFIEFQSHKYFLRLGGIFR
jgi:hypothetical protein